MDTVKTLFHRSMTVSIAMIIILMMFFGLMARETKAEFMSTFLFHSNYFVSILAGRNIGKALYAYQNI